MAIELKNITKTFVERTWRTAFLGKTPKTVRALSDVTFSVRPGEVFGLLGPNGAGKTTLIKILATLIVPDSGKASILGYDLCDHAHQVRSRIGVVNTSERSFYWRLTGRQNLTFFASLCNLSGSAARKRIQALLDLMGINDKADTAFMRYSTGQQQRLALARALLMDPEILLMDEPTRSLDPMAASEIRRFTRKDLADQQGKTVLWCTHNLKEAEEVCDRLGIIHKGKIIASGTLGEMQSILGREETLHIRANRLPHGAYPERLKVEHVRVFQNNGYVEGVFRVSPDCVPLLLKELVNQGIDIYACTPMQTSLETIFERLIGHG